MFKKYSILLCSLSLAAMSPGQKDSDGEAQANASFLRKCVQKMVIDPIDRRYQEDHILYRADIRIPQYMHNMPIDEQLAYIHRWVDEYRSKIGRDFQVIVLTSITGKRPDALKRAVRTSALAYGERVAAQLTVKIPRYKLNELRSIKRARDHEMQQEIEKRQREAGIVPRSRL